MTALLIATTVLAILTFATSLAHALEYPGKMRLERDAYLRTQKIYYPGFTIAGFAEPLSIIAAGVLAFLCRDNASLLPLVATALAMLVFTHAIYWAMTHPVNGFWLADEKLGRAGDTFFNGQESKRSGSAPDDWLALRNRWERSHIIRAISSGAGVFSMLCALAA